MKIIPRDLIIIAIVMIVIDVLFLYFFAGYIGDMIEKIQDKKFEIYYPAAIACYTMLVFSYYYFIVIREGNSFDAFILGFSIYSIYETTNMATIKGWKLKAVINDSLWGGMLFLLTNAVSKSFIRLKD